MRIQFLFATFSATAIAQFTTSVQGSLTATGTLTSSTTARPASIATTSIAVYTPETSIDSWVCATKNYSEYLQPPMPTGELLDVYYDHSDAIYKECEEKLPKPLTTFPACPSVAKASWCAVGFMLHLYLGAMLTCYSMFNLLYLCYLRDCVQRSCSGNTC
jgi:hypothetical protein